MRISDWSSDVCSSDLEPTANCSSECADAIGLTVPPSSLATRKPVRPGSAAISAATLSKLSSAISKLAMRRPVTRARSEEHTSELKSLMRISYAVLRLKKQKRNSRKTLNDRANQSQIQM